LYILNKYVKKILKIIYNSKYYFNINYIIKDLISYSFLKIMRKIKNYINYCPEYLKNVTLRKKLLREINPINTLPILNYIITINFVITLPIYLKSHIFKILNGGFNIILIINSKYNKYTLYIPN
ncbi:hypothetical protein B0T20DRAFT_362929, partial [Sordaria brevicollis]